MNKPTLLKKSKNTTDYITDITKAFTILSNRKKLYHLTIDEVPTPHIQDFYFQLTNKLFNKINKDHRNPYEHVNYLFIMEYGGVISKREVYNSTIDNLGIHAHCLIDTSLTIPQIEFYLNTVFKTIPNYKLQDISKSDTKEGLLNYLLKQNHTGLMTADSYNYKILV
ncbi:hypothetical protein [Mucilaginibacter sp.]|uniref:hypothetical protein n=1 Tax=Mucilaginibacter sp. TaxID=1882438 RepID=UPI0025E3021F|nr:hypothetical protein [Mucilaginibacter sp.]